MVPGYERTPAGLTAESLRAGRTPRRVGRRILVLDEVDSTNTVALDAAAEPDADGLVIFAEAQTAGRGRLGRSWISPRGASLLTSILLIEPRHVAASGPAGDSAKVGAWLTQVTAVAVCEAVREVTDVTPAIKWPNDIRVGGRKLGGILIESRRVGPDAIAWVLGIGLNCLQHEGHFPPELHGHATSLDLVASHGVDRTAVGRELLRRLDDWLASRSWGETKEAHAAWMSFAEPLGQKVRVRRQGCEFAGWTVEIDPVGGLIVRLEGGQLEWFDPMLTMLL
ncbi:MAG: biotin--[acetyl-CoA-carboxylase] ligase [Phycisphaerae bacterium]|nr:biotin--[acetyl-CoA-carboxylase] ligase [Phycisphaerae bacterium]